MSYSAWSDQQKTDFDRDGCVKLPGVFNANEVAALRATVDMQCDAVNRSATGYDFEEIARQIWVGGKDLDVGIAERFDVAILADVIKSDPEARPLQEPISAGDDHGAFVYEASGWRQFHSIRDAALDSNLPEIAHRLMDADKVHFWEDTTFAKKPFTRQKTAFHQDLGFNQFDGGESVILWVALDKVTIKNGGLKYIRGSHKWDETYAPNMFVSQTPMPGAEAPKCPDVEACEGDYDIVSFDLEAGDVVAHDVRTIHGAGGNMTSRARRAISFHYCSGDTRYFERPGAAPRASMTIPKATGDPLDSSDFPTVWPRPWPGARLSDLVELERRKLLSRKYQAA